MVFPVDHSGRHVLIAGLAGSVAGFPRPPLKDIPLPRL